MSTGLWVLTAWLTGTAGFLAGCWWVYRSATDLRIANVVLGRTIVAQQEYIDYLEAGGDVVTEAENLLREPGT